MRVLVVGLYREGKRLRPAVVAVAHHRLRDCRLDPVDRGVYDGKAVCRLLKALGDALVRQRVREDTLKLCPRVRTNLFGITWTLPLILTRPLASL